MDNGGSVLITQYSWNLARMVTLYGGQTGCAIVSDTPGDFLAARREQAYRLPALELTDDACNPDRQKASAMLDERLDSAIIEADITPGRLGQNPTLAAFDGTDRCKETGSY